MRATSTYAWGFAALMLAREGAAQPRRAPRRAPAAASVAVAAPVCVPGAQTRCDCATGSGVQVCNDRGTGLGRCDCGAQQSVVSSSPRSAPTAARPPNGTEPFDPVAVREQRHWYGWQVLLVDLGALALSGAALALGSSALTYTAGGVQLLGPPIVHWSHGRVGAGFGSMGIRIALPLTGALVAYGASSCTRTYSYYGGSNEDCSPRVTAMVIGLAIGQIVASVIDIAALSHETTSTATARRAPRGPLWSASLAPTAHGLELGVGGSF